MFIRGYLRASTADQDANHARADLDAFAAERRLTIAAYYAENESGASLKMSELFRLLDDSKPGDVLLIDRLRLRPQVFPRGCVVMVCCVFHNALPPTSVPTP